MDVTMESCADGVKMERADAITVSFEKMVDLFVKRSENNYVLEPSVGDGHVQIYHLEKGLQVRFWDCCFHESLELFSDSDQSNENTHYTLAFFPKIQGLRFAHNSGFLPENVVWDTLFISANTGYKMKVIPGQRSRCLGISFSK